ncbi:signal transduction histidine kinase [Streptomyces sp. 846.5]|nr:HAMP domain-containing sensor histidine kinase [Streptomyces sp. 846.5]TDT98117.1 signal transduction histidine kinase [Streptomyces sp. 846.5]
MTGFRPFRPRLRRPSTLRGRLALLALAMAAVWVTGLTLAFNLVLDNQLRQQADQQLRARAAAIATTVTVQADGTVTVQETSGDNILDTGVWIYQGSTNIERPNADASLQRAADGLAGASGRFVTVGGSRMYAVALTHAGHQVGTVVTQASLSAYTFTSRAALAGSTTLGLLLLGCVYLVARTVVGRALRPVAEMSAIAAQRSEQGIHEHFGTEGRPAELAELGANLDALLDRMAAVLRDEQRLTAELSHELRTPLARICAETEWLTGRPRSAAEQRAAHQAIGEAAARMQDICRTLLTEARPGVGPRPGRCQAREVLDALARQSRAEHPDAAPITVGGGTGTVGVPAALLERIVAPLLDNARRYADTRITVDYRAAADRAEIAVGDDGPGVPAVMVEQIFQAGGRLDPGDGHDGVGLGLSLSRRLARATGGDVTLRATARGACFVVRLPLA